jgi:hypothetical protein
MCIKNCLNRLQALLCHIVEILFTKNTEEMKTLSINTLSWIRAFFIQADTGPSKPKRYPQRPIVASKIQPGCPNEDTEKDNLYPNDQFQRAAHRGNFSAGPGVFFHPRLFQ